MNRVELVMRRRNVRAFINADPADVQFRRETKTRTPAGGWTVVDLPLLPPQRVRIVDSKRRFADMGINTEAGNVTKWPFIMLGIDIDVQKGDNFTWRGGEYEVMDLLPRNEERTVAALNYLGQVPNG